MIKKTEWTREEELTALLDYVFEPAEKPNWLVVQDYCYNMSDNSTWLMTQLFKLLWLRAEDQVAFDEEIRQLTNETREAPRG